MSLLSPQNLEANRKNALVSTGPKTEEGKAIACRNAIAHGFHARAVVLAEEDAGQFEALHEGLRGAYQPASPQEEMLILQIATDWWKLARMERMERGCFDGASRKFVRAEAGPPPRPGMTAAPHTLQDVLDHVFANRKEDLGQLQNFEERLRRSSSRAFQELHALRKERSAGGSR